MDIELRKAATEEFLLIKNLVPYYIYEMSGSMGWDPNAEGRYDGCDDLPDYWEKPDHHPYLITVDGCLGGFALLRPFPEEPARMEVGEFFVLRKFKGRGIGRASAFQLFDARIGPWLVRVLDGNTAAHRFWAKAISSYTGGRFKRTAEQYLCPHSGAWPMQFCRFESRCEPSVKSTRAEVNDSITLYQRPALSDPDVTEELVGIARELTGEWFTPDVAESIPLDLKFQDVLCLRTDGAVAAFLMFTGLDGAIHITLMGTRPALRGKGYGSRLMAHLLKQMAQWGFERVEAMTVPPHQKPQYAATLRFYQRHGFTVEKEVRDLWRSGAALKLVHLLGQDEAGHRRMPPVHGAGGCDGEGDD